MLPFSVEAATTDFPLLDQAENALATNDVTSADSTLTGIQTDSPILRQRSKDGIAFGVPFFLLKSRIAETQNDSVNCLSFLRMAEGCLSWCVCPTNPALAAKYPAAYNTCIATIDVAMARNARKIAKNYTAFRYAAEAMTFTNIPDALAVSAAVQLAGLYRDQGRFILCYSVCTSLHARAGILPREAYVIKADAAFHLNRTREGFSDLLTVLYSEGIQAEKPEDDPALTLFLRRIARAERSDIFALYDALKAQLGYEELHKGKEHLISFLIQQRLLLAKIFPYLDNQTTADLSAFTARVDLEERVKKARLQAHDRLKQPPLQDK